MYILDVSCSKGGNEYTLRDETGTRYTITGADFKKLEIPFSENTEDYPWFLEDSKRDVVSLMAEKLACIKYIQYYVGSYGSKSIKRLSQKCREKGYSETACEEALSLLSRLGVVDENADCERRAQNMAKTKLLGRYRIKSELRLKGYRAKSIEYALENAEIDFFENAVRLYEKLTKGGKPQDITQRKKIADKMSRYGYSFEEIKYASSVEYGE